MLVPACMSMYSFPSYYPRCGRSGFCNIHLLSQKALLHLVKLHAFQKHLSLLGLYLDTIDLIKQHQRLSGHTVFGPPSFTLQACCTV